MDRLRCIVGGWLYYLGYLILPRRLRGPVSKINAIGLAWIEHDFPERFEITVEK
jgi:hypothetical protein